MTTRRNFLRKAALGSAAISSVAGLSVIRANADQKNINADVTSSGNSPGSSFPGWEILFDEPDSSLQLKNGPISIRGTLGFVSGKDKWTISRSRDGVDDRYALIDLQNNVQGYLRFLISCEQLQLIFYHRTAQSYQGNLSLDGNISFLAESFPCRTRPKADERVLSLAHGPVDSLLNDSLFAPESDTALRMNAAHLSIGTEGKGVYPFAMSGQINESSQAVFTFILEENYYRTRYVPYYHPIDRKRCPVSPTGWMSWNTYFDTATADDNLAEARIGKKYLQPFGCEFWHIESWQGNSDKLPVRDFFNLDLEVSKRKFPKGMKKLADDIRKLGFRPGLWTAPFGTGNTEFYEAHKDWFLHDKAGKPVSCWNGRYTLDPTIPEVREHIKKIHDIASHEWGYEYFKVDGMSGRSHGYCAHLYERPEIRALFRDPSCKNPFELFVKAIREGIGEDRVFLACQGHTSGPEVQFADATRIGADIVHPNKPVEWTGVYNQGRCTVSQVFTHNIVMYGDPDTLLVKDLPLEEARVSTTVVALPGHLTFFGDKLAGLTDDRMKLLQQTLPPASVRPANLYPYFVMLPVWNLRMHNGLMDDYNVVGLFNWNDEPQNISFTTEELGIDPGAEYTLYEFWTQQDLGTMKKTFNMDVPPHAVRLLAMHRTNQVPQWISSDRHVAQNAMELQTHKWNAANRSLEGKIQLAGTFPLTIRVRIPAGFTLSGAECSGAKCSARQESKNIGAITFIAEKTGVYDFRIRF